MTVLVWFLYVGQTWYLARTFIMNSSNYQTSDSFAVVFNCNVFDYTQVKKKLVLIISLLIKILITHYFRKKEAQFQRQMINQLWTQKKKYRVVEYWRSSSPKHLLKKQSPKAGCAGLYPFGFYRSGSMATPEALWAICCHVWLLSQ